jgi:hypothetical protein
MAFTEDDLAYLRSRLGSTVNEDTNADVVDDLEDRYARLQSLPRVVLEVLRQQLADLITGGPLQFSIPGDYSQDASNNVALLTKAVNQAAEEAEDPTVGSVLQAVRPPRSRWAR